ncbi:hypothetical protein [Marinobacter sp. NP-4(2019)]|uniref:hypothetical protein n=1 Tax=Marinobacter sp. NP-4(2019) TaxID=2488665 RepID=UPI001D18C1E6|nr:hypothetical protein [Marinobacter sp. NP-4(2019)]
MTTTMAKREPDQQSGGPTPEQVRRGRRTALLLFAIGFGPMVFATIMYYTGWLNPAGHTNNGELVQPVLPVTELRLQTADGQPLASRFGPERADAEWMMTVVAGKCTEDCENLLYLARQVNIALGKNADRLSRAAFIADVPSGLEARWADEYSAVERLQRQGDKAPAWPAGVQPDREPRILLVDPFGNVMMHYGNEHTGKDMLKDLKHLLKLSQIG